MQKSNFSPVVQQKPNVMRRLIVLILTIICLLIGATISYANEKPQSQKEVVCICDFKQNDHVILKNTQHLKNVMVEIRHENGDFVGFTKMEHKKLTLDFSNVKPGRYQITILGEGHLQQFEYLKELGQSEFSWAPDHP